MIKAQIFFVAAACLFVLATVRTVLVKAAPAASSPGLPVSDPYLLLKSPDAEQRESASASLERGHEAEEDRVQVIAETLLQQSAQRKAKTPNALINQFDNQDDRDARDAVLLLGELRSTRSVPFLIDHLTSLFIFVEHTPSLNEAYPCAGALVMIGSPSLDPLLVRVAQTDNFETTGLAACVFVDVLGNRAAAEFVQERLDKLTSPVARRRLGRLEHTVMRTKAFP